jgi:single-strand DNA-binding protein
MNFNKVILGGRLTAKPELKTFGPGGSVCNFRVASNRFWKDAKGAKQEEPCFIDVVAWNKQADMIHSSFDKGNQILIEGHLKHDVWDGKDGKVHSRHKVVVERVEFIDRKIKLTDLTEDAPPDEYMASGAPSTSGSSGLGAAGAGSSGAAHPAEAQPSVPVLQPSDLADAMASAGGSPVAKRMRERTLVTAGIETQLVGAIPSDQLPF